jgi:hypothetical protein
VGLPAVAAAELAAAKLLVCALPRLETLLLLLWGLLVAVAAAAARLGALAQAAPAGALHTLPRCQCCCQCQSLHCQSLRLLGCHHSCSRTAAAATTAGSQRSNMASSECCCW